MLVSTKKTLDFNIGAQEHPSPETSEFRNIRAREQPSPENERARDSLSFPELSACIIKINSFLFEESQKQTYISFRSSNSIGFERSLVFI